ncbi:transcriptional regulator TbsP [Haladaptatus caseinilyticus]|uniref:transcriptional regulator TbsP n=1 Tax=Haladaptatus caseinilyticus TaxID=2993314 RepID=UPI00224B85A7|nr:DUF5821 family protein [Haladaptatus caseinilyticus]
MSQADLQSKGELFEELFDITTDSILVVNPTSHQLESVITAAVEYEDDFPELRILAREKLVKDLADDFIITSMAVDLINQNKISIRIINNINRGSIIVLEDSVISLLQLNDHIDGLRTEDEDLVETAHETMMPVWENSEKFSFRTPALSEIEESLDDEIGLETKDDFMKVIESRDEIRGSGNLDEVSICLLIAAKNRVLLYDISRWGEDVGVASKATFSRAKTQLQDLGVIDTEKVPIDVGRPRLRLKLADESQDDMDADEMVEEIEHNISA